MSEKLYSTPEVAKILGMSRIAVFKKIKTGKLKAVKVGKGYVVAKADLMEHYRLKLKKAQKKMVPEPEEGLDRISGSENES
ncbi:MAG: 17 protein [Patescibacteria group bacterium]|nr:17 protein [Patescibacteria group bacterium]